MGMKYVGSLVYISRILSRCPEFVYYYCLVRPQSALEPTLLDM